MINAAIRKVRSHARTSLGCKFKRSIRVKPKSVLKRTLKQEANSK